MMASTRVGEDRGLVAAAGLLLAAAEPQVRAEADAARDLGERDGRHQARPPLGELALVEVGVLGVEHDRHGLTEDRVAEELEALVVADAAVLVRVRAVRQRELEQLGIDVDPERVSQGAASFGRRVARGRAMAQTSATLRPLYSRYRGVPAESSTTFARCGRL